jgi:sugar/nucleoside kinase (ribokinase family)
MPRRSDIIAGSVLIDNLIYADDSCRENVIGGAGLYALAGAALFSPSPILVTGTGEDVTETYGPWMARNGLPRDGLRIADPHTPRNILRYLDERTRSEKPVFGHEHFRRLEPTARDVEKVVDGARSLYLFRNTETEIWRGIDALKRQHQFTLLWEIALDACTPQERPRIEALLRHVDAFSLNLEEAGLIFRTSDVKLLTGALQRLPVATVFLRAGRRGSFVIAHGEIFLVPSLAVEPVDVTGGGNAYCGAALVGLAEGRAPTVAAAMGTVAASFAIRQFGPPEAGSPETRAAAQREVAGLIPRIREGIRS